MNWDTETTWRVGVLVFSFLLGSIPFGLLMARVFHAGDVREQGSGNIGATNVTRVAGFWPAGFLTFLLDALKGAIPVVFVTAPFVRELVPDLPTMGDSMPWAAGLFAILGHCFTPWLRFQGGKGVATGLGAIAVLSPIAALVGIAAFGFVFMHQRIGSLASIFGLAFASIAHWVLHPFQLHQLLGALMVFIIVARHRSNIDALLESREKSFR